MKRVLLVEPDQVIGEIVADYLQKHSKLIVDTATNAQDAVHAADQHTPALAIVELAMPRHNGIAFLHEFRSQSDWANVPIIIHSHVSSENLETAPAEWQRLGVVHYLYKPTTKLVDLSEVVRETLGI